jgi:type 1 fimbriae regulatory protein FimB/type 1 fimbriae regulatory protein FimE
MLQTTAQLLFSAKLFSSLSPPPKKPSTRERQYLRTDEIKAMIRAAKKVGRHGVRDGAIILLMFRHGLRTAELVALKWMQIDLAGGYIEVHRVKADAFASSAFAKQRSDASHRVATAFIPYVLPN